MWFEIRNDTWYTQGYFSFCSRIVHFKDSLVSPDNSISLLESEYFLESFPPMRMTPFSVGDVTIVDPWSLNGNLGPIKKELINFLEGSAPF